MPEKHYLGNPLLKKANTEVGLTEEQIVELGRCAIDPVYFARNYVKIVTLDHGLQPFKMYPFQEKMIQAFQDNRFNIVLCCRQSGKCFNVNTIIKIRNKKTGLVQEITIGEFYDKIKELESL